VVYSFEQLEEPPRSIARRRAARKAQDYGGGLQQVSEASRLTAAKSWRRQAPPRPAKNAGQGGKESPARRYAACTDAGDALFPLAALLGGRTRSEWRSVALPLCDCALVRPARGMSMLGEQPPCGFHVHGHDFLRGDRFRLARDGRVQFDADERPAKRLRPPRRRRRRQLLRVERLFRDTWPSLHVGGHGDGSRAQGHGYSVHLGYGACIMSTPTGVLTVRVTGGTLSTDDQTLTLVVSGDIVTINFEGSRS